MHRSQPCECQDYSLILVIHPCHLTIPVSDMYEYINSEQLSRSRASSVIASHKTTILCVGSVILHFGIYYTSSYDQISTPTARSLDFLSAQPTTAGTLEYKLIPIILTSSFPDQSRSFHGTLSFLHYRKSYRLPCRGTLLKTTRVSWLRQAIGT